VEWDVCHCPLEWDDHDFLYSQSCTNPGDNPDLVNFFVEKGWDITDPVYLGGVWFQTVGSGEWIGIFNETVPLCPVNPECYPNYAEEVAS